MRILITGASGFIGNNICNYLLDNLQEVIGVNQKTSYINNIKNPLYSEFIIDISSINEIENLGNLISNVDVIIHAAASLNMQTNIIAATQLKTLITSCLNNIDISTMLPFRLLIQRNSNSLIVDPYFCRE